MLSRFNFDDFEKSLSNVLRCIPALLNCVRSSSTSEYEVGKLNWKDEIQYILFNRVNHCGVHVSTPHSFVFVRLASEAFYFVV